ncbi:mechanosensitive ion channel protein 10, partial [Tanacetum coccineum]
MVLEKVEVLNNIKGRRKKSLGKDRCCIDVVQLIVVEISILTKVFLRYDNEKIYYPNSVLSTKPINNLCRSLDMGDSVELSIDFATSTKKIRQLKEKIKKYGYIKNHKKTVKNKQTRARERKSTKEAKDAKPKPQKVKKSTAVNYGSTEVNSLEDKSQNIPFNYGRRASFGRALMDYYWLIENKPELLNKLSEHFMPCLARLI